RHGESVWLGPAGHRGGPLVCVSGVKTACRPYALTEINVAEAKFSEIMSWDDWKAKARSLEPRCSQCGCVPKRKEREILAISGMCEACATKSDGHTGSWRELCTCS